MATIFKYLFLRNVSFIPVGLSVHSCGEDLDNSYAAERTVKKNFTVTQRPQFYICLLSLVSNKL